MEKNILQWHSFLQRTDGGIRTAPFDYENQARTLLHTCIHKGEDGAGGRAMWDPENHLIRFITDVDFSDPSYHLPHFYELFAKWAQEDDRNFWKEAAQASRQYWKQACHPVTGLCPEYAHFDGTPVHPGREWPDQTRHDWYYSDAYRTIANIGLDAAWFGCSGMGDGRSGPPSEIFLRNGSEK
jgi:oligosaccharide reducing-end xylanase